MGRLDESVRTYLLDGVVIDVMGLLQHVVVGDHGGEHLLVAVLCKFLLERRQRVEVGVKSGGHLQLVVDIQFGILLDGLFVDDTLGVVLVVRIFKLTERHGLTVYCHYNWIVLLRHRCCTANRRNGGEKEGRDKDILFHRFNRWDGYSLVPLM